MYTLRKSKHILRGLWRRFQKRGHLLPKEIREKTIEQFVACDTSICQLKRKEGEKKVRLLHDQMRTLLPKTFFERTRDFLGAILFALVVAILIRSMWFELYEIPSGSMRPTFKEHDHLVASKTTFGINVPMLPDHLYFDPSKIKRTDIVIFSVENMEVANPDTLYFYLIPGKRLLVKRLIGKPGDTLYFYGGKIYGIDADKKPILELQDLPWIAKIDHIPYISFEGREKNGQNKEIFFYQSGIQVGKLSINNIGLIKGSVFNGTRFVPEETLAYSDLFGMRNFAMAKLLSPKEAASYPDLPQGELYLELQHTPSLAYPVPRFYRTADGLPHALLTPQQTIIPLDHEALMKLMDNLYTARFVVKNGQAKRFSAEESMNHLSSIPLAVPDGTYEFQNGKAYEIHFGGISIELPKTHPLYDRSLERIKLFFNQGFDFSPSNSLMMPQRFAYYRDGSFVVMGAEVYSKDSLILQKFIEHEEQMKKASLQKRPYIGFIDLGPPDISRIEAFGLKVPKGYYYVLGDNYAMSADSRDFGFVPEDNLRGSPAFILWPPGHRFGTPAQPFHSPFTASTLIIWGLAFLIIGGWYVATHRSTRKPIDFHAWPKNKS